RSASLRKLAITFTAKDFHYMSDNLPDLFPQLRSLLLTVRFSSHMPDPTIVEPGRDPTMELKSFVAKFQYLEVLWIGMNGFWLDAFIRDGDGWREQNNPRLTELQWTRCATMHVGGERGTRMV